MPDFPIYNKCNNHCIMCSNPKTFWQMDDHLFNFSNLSERIENSKKSEKEFLNNYRDAFSITGGEPTLSPHLFDIIKKISGFFPRIKISCLTNGRMFSYSSYARKFLQVDNYLELVVPIHGHNAEIHDKITQTSGSFLQTIEGLKNIFRFNKLRCVVEIRVVIHHLNYKFLNDITKLIKDNFSQVNRLVFIFFEIEGQAVKNLHLLKLTYTELLPFMDKIYNLLDTFSDVRFYHFPLCSLPTKFFPYVWRTLPHYEVGFSNVCRICKVKKLCLGIHKGYLKYIGDKEFQPITQDINLKISNDWYRPIEKIEV